MSHDDPKEQNQRTWGVSQHLFIGANVDLAVAYGKKSGASSMHYHAFKHNTFIVLSGKVLISTPSDDFVLGPDQDGGLCVTVRAGILHRMEFLEDSVLHEFYQAVEGHPLELGDIVRLEPGWEPKQCDKPSE